MDYEFQSHWTPVAAGLPQGGDRCIVTDGDTIVTATYAVDVWVIDGMGTDNNASYKIIGWMPAPKPMKKVVTYGETIVEQN